MKTKHPVQPGLALLLWIMTALSATAALVTVNSVETWDGVANPHAADGVTLSGSGNLVEPAIYTIPNGMHITATGSVVCQPSGNPNDLSIQFNIQGGDLQMDAGAILNIERYNIRTGRQHFILDLDGINSITGAGQILGLTVNNSTPRILFIQNVMNVAMKSIDLHVQNTATDARHMSITASGAVVITGAIDNTDRDAGGGDGSDVTIKAGSIMAGSIFTQVVRDIRKNGNITLQALSPLGNYDPNNATDNSFTNKITINGTIRTGGTVALTGGNVTLQGVVVQFNPAFGLIMPASATLTFDAGLIQNGAGASDIFIDYSASGLSPVNDVQWSGPFVPPPGGPPSFTVKPISRPSATQDVAYAATLAGSATDPDLDPLAYAKVNGPAWLQVASDGTLSGTPAGTNTGTNSWIVSVSDGVRFDQATLNIFVSGGPRFSSNPIIKPPATQNVAYASTLVPNVIVGSGAPLTFSKLAGPAWLGVAPDGPLSGTPASTDTTGNWTVSVTDSTYTNTATLSILVNGSARFLANPTVAPTDRVGVDYAVLTINLTSFATDPQNLPMTFSKVSGPAWLQIASSGALSGAPAAADLGTNSWTVSVSDGLYPATSGTLLINVIGVRTGAVEVASTETWDGILNPHVVDGVTLSGAGTEADPRVYTIPGGLHVASTGSVYNNPIGNANDVSIEFRITQGDLTIDDGANIYIARHTRSGRQVFVLDLGGGSIGGAGGIIGLISAQDTPRVLFITNVNNVTLKNIDLHVESVGNQGRHMFITASGAVVINGTIDQSDTDTGGNATGNVTISAASITLSNITTVPARTSGTSAGRVSLKALSPVGGYDPDAATANNYANKLTLKGAITTLGNDLTGAGHITNQAVVVQFNPGFTNVQPGAAVFELRAGTVQGPATEQDLFINNATVPYTPSFDVQWSEKINQAVSGGNLVLSWGVNGFVLQQNTNLHNTSGWVNVPGGNTSPISIPMTNSATFFRLKF